MKTVKLKPFEGVSGLTFKADIVEKVDKGSAAEKQGIKKGYRCTAVNDVACADEKDLAKALLTAKHWVVPT